MTTSDLVNYRADEKAQNAVWTHCCSAAFIKIIIESIQEGLIDETFEICVTKDSEAGLFDAMGISGLGVFLKGRVTAMFTRDIGSSFRSASNSRRTFYSEDCDYLVEKYDELVAKDSLWTESFLILTKLVGIWMTCENYEYIHKNEKKNKQQFWKRIGLEGQELPIVTIV